MDFQGPRCETCRHFFIEADAKEGLCRRYPPQVVLLGVKTSKAGKIEDYMTAQRFPSMLPSGVCGEWSDQT